MSEFSTGAVFDLIDESGPTFKDLFINFERLDKAVVGVQGKLEKIVPRGFFASIDRAGEALRTMPGIAESSATGIIAGMGRLDGGLSPIFSGVTEKAKLTFDAIPGMSDSASSAVLGSMKGMQAGVIEQFDIIKNDGAGLFTGFGTAATTASDSIVAAMNTATTSVTALVAETRAAVAELSALKVPVMEGAVARAALGDAASHGGGRGHGGFSFHSRAHGELPGGTRLNIGGNGALAALGVTGAAIYEASELDDTIIKALITGQLPVGSDPMRSAPAMSLRALIEKTSAISGYSLKDSGESFLGIERMLGGVDFKTRMSVLDTILPYAGLEARMKEGTSLKESFESFVGMAHMTGEYNPDKLKDLAKAFAFTSINTTASLPQFEKTLSYSLPMLHNALGMDANSVMMMMTAMAMNAGITSTKSGTWIRSFFEGAEPGQGFTASVVKHNSALRELGLLDGDRNVTWRKTGEDGKIDWTSSVINMAGILGAHLQNLPIDKRLATLKDAFGERGGGIAAMMGLDTFVEQMPVFAGKLRNFTGADKALEEYAENSPIQKSRQALRDFENILADLGDKALPTVNASLRELQGIASGLGSLIKGDPKELSRLFFDKAIAPDLPGWVKTLPMPPANMPPAPPPQTDPVLSPFFSLNAYHPGDAGSGPLADAVYGGFLRAFKEIEGGGAGGFGGTGSGIVNASYTTFGGGGGALGRAGAIGDLSGVGGGAWAQSGATKSEVADYVRRAAAINHIEPDVMLRVAQSEGLNRYTGDYGTSYGAMQLHYGGSGIPGMNASGLGDIFTKLTGLDAHDPKTWKAQIDFAAKWAAQHGWADWHGARRAGIGDHEGIGTYHGPVPSDRSAPPYAGPPPRKVTPGAPAGGHHDIEAAVHRALDGAQLAVNVGFDERAQTHIAKFVTKRQAQAMRFPTSMGGPNARSHYTSPGTPVTDSA